MAPPSSAPRPPPNAAPAGPPATRPTSAPIEENKSPVSTISESRTTEEIYTQACAFCHDRGMAGAPIYANTFSWGQRVDKGIDTLTYNVKYGLNAMPAMGLCADCTDEELRSVVQYMLDSLD